MENTTRSKRPEDKEREAPPRWNPRHPGRWGDRARWRRARRLALAWCVRQTERDRRAAERFPWIPPNRKARRQERRRDLLALAQFLGVKVEPGDTFAIIRGRIDLAAVRLRHGS